jgi:beta-lactam-binding protein with PASTA domain
MGTGRYPDGASDEAAEIRAEDATLADDDSWPVAEQYRIEPPAQPADEEGTVIVQRTGPPEPASVRRFPPALGPGALATGLAVVLLLLLIPGGLWLVSRSDDDSNAATGPETLGTTTEQPTTTAPTTTTPAETAVPDVTGRTLRQARELLEKAELRVRFRRVASGRPPNEVLSQRPTPSSEVDPTSIVVLTVSGGQERVAVPDVVGATASEASELLREAGLEPRKRRVESDGPQGTVVEQTPAAGEEVGDGTVVTLEIARKRASTQPSAPATVRVPSLVGMTSAEARSRLRGLGLRSTQRPVESPRPPGTVVSQSPAAGAELSEGRTVTLQVSTGPAEVAIPDVVGLTEAAAIRELEDAGFVAQVVDQTTGEPTEDGVVLAQSPPAGSSVRAGGTVTITVARFS